MREITLLVPDLVRPERPLPPVLRRFLARSDQVPMRTLGFEARLFGLFGYTAEAGRDLPVAAVTRLADTGIVDKDWWIRADPVYLEMGRDNLILRTGLGLLEPEAKRLAAELSESVAADGWLLRAPHPERWYLRPPAEAAISTTPLADATGRDIYPLLPQGADRRAWHTRLTELQILLHGSTVNTERQARGQIPANSVWFWGGGGLPELPPVKWEEGWATDPLCVGLARLAAVSLDGLPRNAVEGLRSARDGATLVVLERPTDGAAFSDSWVDDWLQPLVGAVHSGQLDSLTVLSATGPVLYYLRRHRWRVWRRAGPKRPGVT